MIAPSLSFLRSLQGGGGGGGSEGQDATSGTAGGGLLEESDVRAGNSAIDDPTPFIVDMGEPMLSLDCFFFLVFVVVWCFGMGGFERSIAAYVVHSASLFIHGVCLLAVLLCLPRCLKTARTLLLGPRRKTTSSCSSCWSSSPPIQTTGEARPSQTLCFAFSQATCRMLKRHPHLHPRRHRWPMGDHAVVVVRARSSCYKTQPWTLIEGALMA